MNTHYILHWRGPNPTLSPPIDNTFLTLSVQCMCLYKPWECQKCLSGKFSSSVASSGRLKHLECTQIFKPHYLTQQRLMKVLLRAGLASEVYSWHILTLVSGHKLNKQQLTITVNTAQKQITDHTHRNRWSQLVWAGWSKPAAAYVLLKRRTFLDSLQD